MHFIGIFNKDGGTFRLMDMAAFVETATERLRAAGHSFEARLVSGPEVAAALAAAAKDPRADVLLAGGGDGTISAAASVAFETGKPLAVLPAGTMNMFARSLGVPLDLEAALDAFAEGTIGRADIATANGRPFVHQFAVGIHARLVRLRDQYSFHGRWGKIIASGRAILRAVDKPPVFLAEIATPHGIERREATGISITNNLIGEGHIPHADRLDQGVLGVYLLSPMSAMALARFCFGVAIGRWKNTPEVSESEVSRVTLSFPRRKKGAHALIDGELVALDREVELAMHPGGLSVLLPRISAEPRPVVAA